LGLADTLKEVQSLKKDKSWSQNQGGLTGKTSKSQVNDKEGTYKQMCMLPVILIKL
jgi:hypothetical protein